MFSTLFLQIKITINYKSVAIYQVYTSLSVHSSWNCAKLKAFLILSFFMCKENHEHVFCSFL